MCGRTSGGGDAEIDASGVYTVPSTSPASWRPPSASTNTTPRTAAAAGASERAEAPLRLVPRERRLAGRDRRHDDSGDARLGKERHRGRDPVARRTAARSEDRDELPAWLTVGDVDPGIVEQLGRGRVAGERDEGQLLPRADSAVEQQPLPLVRPSDAEAVEDRRGVPERTEDSERPDPRAREPIVEPDGKLADPVVAARARHRQQLEIEGEALHQQQRQHFVGHAAAEDLEPDLRVLQVEAEEQPVQLLVAPARDATRARIVDDGLRVSLRSNREVELLGSGDVEESRDRGRVEVEVCVDERHPLTVRGERARLDGIALAEVPVVVDDADATLCTALEQPLGGAVDRAVRDDDHFQFLAGKAGGDARADLIDVPDDLVAAVVNRNDDRQEHGWSTTPMKWACRGSRSARRCAIRPGKGW